MISPTSIDPTSQEIRILSLWQPWASFIAWRLKQYETRSWYTAYRGLIAIHAAKRQVDAEGLHLIDQVFQLSGSHQRGICEVKSYPLGAIVAVCELTDCRVMRHSHPQAIGTGIEIEA
ncbi:ASCH domain-containing protein [Leptolyngbya sp. FACHB-36]|uniref:ASCH domain-containing protein n=1 Tax=Leptolyngbya sp. FACHB-36 TaxID=2692808 RepID=UPI001681843E|nr:ASCH domain-containing protein [Leptolyngbya sp. FACHB-36]